MKENKSYQTPWYLRDGLVQTIATSLWYGNSWNWLGEKVPWLAHLPPIPWQEKVFTGAEDVPLWGMWSCPPQAKGTMILNYGITGTVATAWYAHVVARKAYQRGWAVVLYDWRSHGKTAELSPAPSSDGWREGVDQVKIAEAAIAMGCPAPVALIGFSLGGQLALWGLQAAVEEGCELIFTGAVIAPNLESNRSLQYLVSTPAGRFIEQTLTKELQIEAQKRQDRFPQAVKPGAVAGITSIDSFDREMVINYYGFASVEEYYQKTSGLELLDQLKLPFLVVYAADDPMFDPTLVKEIEQRMSNNPHGYLLMTPQGGHVAHIGVAKGGEDEFWGFNRLLDFCDNQILLMANG
ncbi:MAG: alpha/beta fold hydrolase [Spirulinaceae cyanobacterium]